MRSVEFSRKEEGRRRKEICFKYKWFDDVYCI